jgi:hypothetical protein
MATGDFYLSGFHQLKVVCSHIRQAYAHDIKQTSPALHVARATAQHLTNEMNISQLPLCAFQ